jgi:hypothetical protein
VIKEDAVLQPRSAALSMLRIGRNQHGNWIVQDRSGQCHGLFGDRAEALRFALYDNGNRPRAVIMVPGVLGPSPCESSRARPSGARSRRRAA